MFRETKGKWVDEAVYIDAGRLSMQLYQCTRLALSLVQTQKQDGLNLQPARQQQPLQIENADT